MCHKQRAIDWSAYLSCPHSQMSGGFGSRLLSAAAGFLSPGPGFLSFARAGRLSSWGTLNALVTVLFCKALVTMFAECLTRLTALEDRGVLLLLDKSVVTLQLAWSLDVIPSVSRAQAGPLHVSAPVQLTLNKCSIKTISLTSLGSICLCRPIWPHKCDTDRVKCSMGD